MISTGEIKRGITVEIDGQLYQIMEFQHIKMGRGSAQVRMKLRNVRKGDTIEKTVQAGERFQRARLDHADRAGRDRLGADEGALHERRAPGHVEVLGTCRAPATPGPRRP